MIKLTDTAIKVLKKRYFLDDHGSVENLFHTVAKQVCRDDDDPTFEGKCFQSMCSLEFLPNTPTLINAGRNNGQYAACFVLPMEDSTDKIFDTLKHTALIHKTGGGTGFSFTNLRPKNSIVSGSFGVSSGPISFMKIFNRATGEMKQGGVRRGANMGILRIDHPDIEEFITCKNEEGVLSNFNISVAITDEFMTCLKEKKKFNLRWSNGKIRIDKKVDSQKLWDLIIKGAWLNGEPGVIFIDTINRKNILKEIETIHSTNPCLPAWGRILTKFGIREIGEVKVGMKIWSSNGWVKVIRKRSAGIKKVYRYRTNGGIFYGTKKHQVFSEGKKVQVDSANSIDQLIGPRIERVDFNLRAVVDGLLIGDGSWNYRGKVWGYPYLNVGSKDMDYYKSDVFKYFKRKMGGTACDCWKIKTKLGELDLVPLPERKIPKKYLRGSSAKVLSFLRGLFSANGFVLESARQIGLDMVSSLVEDVQIMLSSVGIASSIYMRKSVAVEHRGGVYISKPQYCLRICSYRVRFADLIGFIQKYKNDSLNNINKPNGIKKVSYDITDVSYVSTEEVFDITVDGKNHDFWYDTEMTANCGEQPLPPYGICVLGSINLSKFLRVDQSTDYNRLEETIRMGVRFLDNIVSVNTYPLPEIEEEAMKTRRIGLGIMGLADYLILKNIRYGSKECLEHLHHLMKFFSEVSNSESVNLGKERGVPSVLERFGINRRNGTVTTIAPTGSLSLIAGCSSGCEPIFAKKYKKSCIDTTLDVKSSTLIKEENSAFVTAMDISPEDHISVLSVLQKYVDSGISKTINAPNSISKDEVSDLFRLCYDSDCKSVSFYREGSRVFQALTPEEKPKEEYHSHKSLGLKETTGIREYLSPKKDDTKIRKRPECLNGYTKCVKTGRGKLYVTVNNDGNDNPFEVFLRIGKSGMEDLAYSEALGRLISLSLRCGLPIKSIIKNLSGISGDSPIWIEGRLIKSVPDAVAYVISTLCGEEVDNKKVKPLPLICPDCGEAVVFEEGCVSCKECGWSKCS